MLSRTWQYGRRALSSTSAPPARKAVLVEGVRTPFAASGTLYTDLMAVELARLAIHGLLTKTALAPTAVDYCVLGTVIQESRTSNIAREAVLSAGLPYTLPAHTVTLACISANVAISAGCAAIALGTAETVIVGGVETMSDVPIRFSRAVRKRMLASQKAKTLGARLGLLKGLRAADLAPELPAIAEYSTGEVMGASADRLAAAWGVSRADSDAFALRSHKCAAAAHSAGLLRGEIVAVEGNTWDNIIKADSTAEKLASLKPAFAKPHGTVTAGNASSLSDGASAALLMSEAAALRGGFTPKATLVDQVFVARDPRDELLLGPAYAVAQLLQRNGLAIKDVGVWELHEAFAGQVCANLNALDSDTFAQKNLGRGAGATRVGRVPLEALNTLGGSLSLGHPFGATGTRLLTTAANRCAREGSRYGVIAACAAGGQGVAMLIERWQPAPK